MQELWRWLASWKGIDVEPGTELRFELSSFPSGGMGMLAVLGIIAALVLVWVAYRRDAARLSAARRLTLASLRAVAVLFACLLLLEPNLVTVKREVRPGHSIVLLDVSQSMSHRDTYRHAEVAPIAQAWQKLGNQNLGSTDRMTLAKSLLSADDYAVLRQMAKRNKVLVYGFESGLEPLAVLPYESPDESLPVAADAGEDAKPLDLATVEATGRFSNPGDAVRRALERSREAAVAGVIMLSDGRRNLGPPGPEVGRLLGQRRVPHTIVVPIGDPSETRTLQLTRIEAPEKVFQEDPFTIRANLESEGYTDVLVTVRLKRQPQSGGDSFDVTSRELRLGTDVPQGQVVFDSLRSAEAGLFTYVVEIDPPEFEAPSPERHIQRKQIEVLGEQTSVMLISGSPSHEYRILRNLLQRDKTIELACWLCSADPDFPQDGNISLEELPTEREELEDFDVFILMDPNSKKLDAAFCELLAQQVLENGAGMWWVCGEKYTLDAVRAGASTYPLAQLLPVELDIERADTEYGLGRGMPRTRRFRLTPDGEVHKATRIMPEREASTNLWAALPGFHFAFPVERAKPAAQLLATYEDQTEFATTQSPMFVTHYVGSGRVLFSATDDTYRWRAAHEYAYDRFWVKGIRHLFEGRLNAGNSRLKIFLDEEKLELGQAMKITVEARTETYQPLIAPQYDLTLTREDGSAETLPLSPIEAMPGSYETRLRPTQTGYYRLGPTTDIGSNVQATFQVVPAAIEKEGRADLAELEGIASAQGGVLLETPDQFAELATAIPSLTVIDPYRTAHAIWDSWLTIGIVLTLLAIEWWLRKRSNLL